MGDAGALVVQSRITESLTPAERSAVIDLCIAAHDIEDFRNLFTNVGNGRHFLGYQGAELVSHAVVTTRWAQPEGLRVLQTAYVDAVSTAPDSRVTARTDSSRLMRKTRALGGVVIILLRLFERFELVELAVPQNRGRAAEFLDRRGLVRNDHDRRGFQPII